MKSAEGLKKWGLVCLALPFLAMGFMVATNQAGLSADDEYRLEIEGYDPRDLLRGHFLIFRYKWPDNADDIADGTFEHENQVCACLSGNPQKPDVHFEKCAPASSSSPTCNKPILMADWVSRWTLQPDESLRQFYIPEQHARMLEDMLRSNRHKFEVGLVPQGEGKGRVKELYIDGIPLDQFLKSDLEAYTISR